MARDPELRIRYLNGEEIKQAMITGFRQALAGGVKIGAGTDAGLVDHASVWKEMQYFVEIGGISRELALHLGTLGTAESIGLADITGSVEPGKFADLLVVDEDPRSDLSTLARPRLVVAAGVIVEPLARRDGEEARPGSR
jgi:imidazolonepropionase-like amidohydrolase